MQPKSMMAKPPQKGQVQRTTYQQTFIHDDSTTASYATVNTTCTDAKTLENSVVAFPLAALQVDGRHGARRNAETLQQLLRQLPTFVEADCPRYRRPHFCSGKLLSELRHGLCHVVWNEEYSVPSAVTRRHTVRNMVQHGTR